MQTAKRAALNGIQLDEIDERIVISSITESDGKDQITTAAWADYGSRVTGRRRETLDVIIRFGIDIRKGDMAKREKVMDAIRTWAAGGGLLTLNYKENRQLRCILAQAPGSGNPWDWTANYAIALRACEIPYWEQANPVTGSTETGTSGSIALAVAGNVDTVGEVTLTNMSGANISNCTITAGSSSIALTGLNLGADEAVVIDHDGKLIRIRIRSGGSYRSAMGNRTTGSAHDLTVSPGGRIFSFTAQRACRMTASVRGRYL